jgi:hypothetical protein
MTTAAIEVRALLEDQAFADVAATVQRNNLGMDVFIAGRIVTEALAFVATAAAHPTDYISPSRTVDEGWHALILNTAVYEQLCGRLGRFVHHHPEAPDPDRHDEQIMQQTLALICSTGHNPDMDLWTPPANMRIPVAADCSHTPKPGGCGPINPGNCASHCNSGGGGGGGE